MEMVGAYQGVWASLYSLSVGSTPPQPHRGSAEQLPRMCDIGSFPGFRLPSLAAVDVQHSAVWGFHWSSPNQAGSPVSVQRDLHSLQFSLVRNRATVIYHAPRLKLA